MIALALAGLLAIQAPAAQFDLVCEGARTDLGGRGGVETVSYRLRIDLENNRWCQDSCASAGPMHAVSTDRIELIESQHQSTTYYSTTSSWIDRNTGVHHFLSSIRRRGVAIGHTIRATCERAEFSGMPAPRF